MKEIKLTKGKFALVDDDDFEWLSQWNWYFIDGGYAARSTMKGKKNGGEKKMYYMHRQILNPPVGFLVDHIDGNRLNNQRYNLRACLPSGNSRNRKLRCDNTSGYKGVLATANRWRATIGINGKSHHIGVFDNIIDAARAYDKKAREVFGEFAKLNFPDD